VVDQPELPDDRRADRWEGEQEDGERESVRA
jgi:hypothetical protein